MASQIQYFYPSYILNEAYDNRRVTFYIKETSLSKSVDIIADKANKIWEDVKSLTSNLTSDKDYEEVKKELTKMDNSKTIVSISLPLPNSMIDTQAHQYSQEDGLAKTATNKIDKFGIRNKADYIAGLVSSQTGMRKPMVDPGYFQNYVGSEPRGFGFSFDFIPNNKQEAEQIKNIITLFKKSALPETVISGTALLSPSSFDIEIGNSTLNNITRMNSLVLTNIDITFGVEGDMQLFSDGTPKMITMNLAFKERYALTRNYY